MTEPVATGLTALLSAAAEGDADAARNLWALIYDELRAVARRQLAQEAPGHTLQPTALVHEAYMRLLGGNGRFENRRHFFAAAANAMRQIRIDDARRRGRLKRGGDNHRPGSLEEAPAVFDQNPIEVLAVDEAITRLRAAYPRAAEVVVLRYFTGLSIDETAEALEMAPRSVDNDWKFAKAWLQRELGKGDTAPGFTFEADV